MIGEIEIIERLAVAVGAGLLLGLDRELRGQAAGLRTHALVSLSAAVSTVSALLLFEELQEAGGSGGDPLRVMQGLAQAIGFIAAGVIFSQRGSVHNLTTAATIWLAAVLGITAGAGQHLLAGLTVGIGLVLLIVLHVVERHLPGSRKAEDGGNDD